MIVGLRCTARVSQRTILSSNQFQFPTNLFTNQFTVYVLVSILRTYHSAHRVSIVDYWSDNLTPYQRFIITHKDMINLKHKQQQHNQ